jgi:cytochrome c556
MMRFALTLLASCALAGCGGPETSQANNAQANMSNSAQPPATANASATSNGMVMLSAAPGQQQALAIMHERHEGMETIGKANKAIKRELDGSSPDLAVVRASAARIAQLSQKASGWFARGTGPELGKTGARPEIWQNPRDFIAKLHDFQNEAKAFNAAAAGNDLTLIRTQFGDLGQACKACHDKYRSEMHH